MPRINILVVGQDQASGPLNKIAGSVRRIGEIAAGLLVHDVFNKIKDSIIDLGKEAVTAAAEFQTLGIRYETLIAREMRGLNVGDQFAQMLGDQTDMADYQITQFANLRDMYDQVTASIEQRIDAGLEETDYTKYLIGLSDDYAERIKNLIPGYEGMAHWQQQAALGGLDMADALMAAQGPADEMLDWVKVISVKTPFSAESVATATSLGMAMGFTMDQAKSLTVATGDFTAGMGLSNKAMERILYNFGQMKQQGKVTGTELRDLARGGFVPITDVLRRMQENLGLTSMDFDDFRKAAAKGKYDVDEFFTAFQDMAAEDFPNAMERMAKSWKGVTENTKDFLQNILGVQVAGPILETISESLYGVLESFTTVDAMKWLGELGDGVDIAFQVITGVLNNSLIPAIRDLFGALGIEAPDFSDLKLTLIGFSVDVAEKIRWLTEKVETLTEKIPLMKEKFQEVKDTLQPFIDQLKEFWEKHGPNVLEVLERFIKILGVLVAAKAVIVIIGAIAGVIGSIVGPLLAVAGIIALVWAAWENNWGGIQEIVASAVDWIMEKLQPFVDWWNENWPLISAVLQTAWIVIQDAVMAAWDVIKPAVDTFLEAMEDFKTKAGPTLERFAKLWESLKVVIAGVAAVVGAIVTAVFSVIVGAVKGFFNALSIGLPIVLEVFGFIAQAFQGLLDIVINVAKLIFNVVTGNWEAISENLQGILEGIRSFLDGIMNSILLIISGAIGVIISFFAGLVTGIIDWFKNLKERLIGHSIIPDMINAIIDAFKNFVTLIQDKIKAFVTNLVSRFQIMKNKLVAKVRETVTGIIDRIKGFIGNMKQAGKDLIGGFFSGVKDKFEEVKRWVKRKVDDLISEFKKLFKLGSESKLFNQFGEWVGGGFLTGLEDEFGKVSGVISSQLKEMESTISGASVDPSLSLGGAGGTRTTIFNFHAGAIQVSGADDPQAVADEILRRIRRQLPT
jgi:tape measure domain-containing protein